MRSSRVVLASFAVGASLLVGACGSSSVTEPDAPQARGASIEGTVHVGSTSGVQALAANSGVKVTVQGTGSSTITDGSGRFTLRGLPSGSLTLRFEAPGVDARLEVSGLQDGQVLSVTVRLEGNHASLISPAPQATPSPDPTPSPDQETEFRGRIESLGSSTLVVAGQTVRTDGNTRIRRRGDPISFSDLKVGQTVEVEGHRLSDGSLLAEKITVEDDDDDDDEQEVEFLGAVQSVTPPTLMVASRTVVTDGNTRITRKGDSIPLSSLRAGDIVEVKGTMQPNGDVLARRINLEH